MTRVIAHKLTCATYVKTTHVVSLTTYVETTYLFPVTAYVRKTHTVSLTTYVGKTHVSREARCAWGNQRLLVPACISNVLRTEYHDRLAKSGFSLQ